MNILIIDNGTKHIKELKSVFFEYNFKVIKRNNLNNFKYNDFDLIVLSGSSKLSVVNHPIEYENEINLIKTSKIPIIGICLGFELICYTFNEKLSLLKKKRKGLLKVHKVLNTKILSHINSHFFVYDSHRWGIKNTDNLLALAKSKDGIEIVKHPTKKIYGLQFHPEVFKSKSKGYLILKNIINSI